MSEHRLLRSNFLQRYNFLPLLFNTSEIDNVPFRFTLKSAKSLIQDFDHEELLVPESLYYEGVIDSDENFFNSVVYERIPTIRTFFTYQAIDIPHCLTSAQSLYTPIVSYPHLRLVNMLMRHGRKSLISRSYSKTAITLSNNLLRNSSILDTQHSWLYIHMLFTHQYLLRNKQWRDRLFVSSSIANTQWLNSSKHLYNKSSYSITCNDWFKDSLLRLISLHTPLFSFFVKKVDKLRRKHSRGKTGKYIIVWKYIPLYKRLTTVLHWIIKDVRFNKSKTFSERFESSIKLLFTDTSSHLIYKLRQFVHKFVFNTHKKTLLKTLKSVS